MNGRRRRNADGICTVTEGRSSRKGNGSALWGGVIGTVTTFATKDNLVCEIDNDMEKEKKSINLPPELEGKKFRIRKLTPRECFRLMGVDDEDIDKIQAAGISNSGQYRLAGNSIVVDVLYYQFVKAFIQPGEERKAGTQLTFDF